MSLTNEITQINDSKEKQTTPKHNDDDIRINKQKKKNTQVYVEWMNEGMNDASPQTIFLMDP